VLFLFLFALLGFATQQEERAAVVKEAGFLQRGKKHPHAGRFRNRGKVYSAALFSAPKHTGVK
jgi:hypothetical protein